VSEWVNQGNAATEAGLPDFAEEEQMPGTDVTQPGFGAIEILEGQARLCEIQYLSVFARDRIDWKTCVNRGMLAEPYGTAFRYFISHTGLPWPDNSLDTTVGLFLLACDITLNPGDIYPFARFDPRTLVRSTHPAARFDRVTTAVAKLKSKLLHNFQYDDSAYVRFSEQICAEINETSPQVIAAAIVSLFDEIPGTKPILDGDPGTVFSLPSIPLKFYIWKHHTFMRDRMQHPAYFCWPAPSLVRMTLIYPQVFTRNEPPLVSPSLDGRIMASGAFCSDKGDVENGLYNFLMSQLMNDVIRQWIAKPGPFVTSYDWIDPTVSPSVWQKIVRDYFKDNFDFPIDGVKVIM
jgi:hypothetical protein